MSEINELYQQVILDHNKNPRNFGELSWATHKADGHNPLCGDKVHVELILNKENIVVDIAFSGDGCAISRASSSIMTEIVKGKTKEETIQLFEEFQKLITTDSTQQINTENIPKKLSIFTGVREFPARVKCASLSWHTLKAALDENDQEIKTE